MHTRLSYLGGIAAIILAFFPENNLAKFAFGTVGVVCLILAYIFQNKKSPKTVQRFSPKVLTNKKPLEISSKHIAILKVFRQNAGELTSVPIIRQHTDLETIIINSALNDLEKHNLIQATNLDELEGGWQYQLSDKGIKTILNFT